MYKSYGRFMQRMGARKKENVRGPTIFGHWGSTKTRSSSKSTNKKLVPEEAIHLHPAIVRKRYPELMKNTKKGKKKAQHQKLGADLKLKCPSSYKSEQSAA